jgi:chaperonin cofactor prefoldin
VTLFPVALEEFRAHLSKAIDMQEKAIETAERDLKAKESVLQAMYGQVRAALAPAKTKEIEHG